MKGDKKDGIVKNAFILGLGTFIAKLMGAIYRVPLIKIIGSLGLGLYQMVFPVYALLLDFSGAGAPGALAKIISSFNENKEQRAYDYLKTGYRLLSILGIVFSLLMLFFAKPLARLQGNERAYLGYVFLSPAIFFVCLISCLRGYFQGLMNMKPVATSQLVEQGVKLILGLIFAYLLKDFTEKAVAGAIFAITLSEVFAFIILYLTFIKRKNDKKLYLTFDKKNIKTQAKQIVKYAFPIIIVGILIPLSQVIDSFVIVRILSKYTSSATALFGLLSGVALTVINLPVSVCYGIATVAIPSVSSGMTIESKEKRCQKLLMLTLIVALPCAIFCYFFSPFIVRLLFNSLPIEEKAITINLLKILSPCIVLLSLIQTQNAILIGKNKLYLPSFSLLLGIIIKTAINVVLLNNPRYNIYGGAFGIIACYFSACLINLIMIIRLKVKDEYKIVKFEQLKIE